jgi:hypothetical protein
MTPFSPFDKRLLEEGLAYFDRPRLASLLEQLGSSKPERTAALEAMLRHCPPEEFTEAVEIFERAIARADRKRQRESAEERPDRPERRPSRSAERRAQRRRSS